MTLILNGSVGVSDVDGSAATPAIRGTDANTGMFFPAADTIAFAEGGVESMRIDSSGNVSVAAGNLTFSGTGQRITGDFSNATIANRVLFQSSTTNGATSIGVLPNGTSTFANINLFNGTDPANASIAQIVNTGAEVSFRNAITGTGTLLPMTFYTGGSERMRIDTSGNVGIGTSSPAASLSITKQTTTLSGTGNAYGLYAYPTSSGLVYIDAVTSGAGNTSLGLRTYSNGTYNDAVRIDASGIITEPYQTAFNAYGGGTQSFGGAQSTVVVQFNVQNSLGVRSTGYNTSTYRFTAPVSGAYLLCGRIVNTTSGSTGPELFFRVNGSSTLYAAINYANNSYVTTSGQVVVYLNASDYVEACITNNNSTSFTLDLTRSNFCGFLIG